MESAVTQFFSTFPEPWPFQLTLNISGPMVEKYRLPELL